MKTKINNYENYNIYDNGDVENLSTNKTHGGFIFKYI
jgi:hypothetical protein